MSCIDLRQKSLLISLMPSSRTPLLLGSHFILTARVRSALITPPLPLARCYGSYPLAVFFLGLGSMNLDLRVGDSMECGVIESGLAAGLQWRPSFLEFNQIFEGSMKSLVTALVLTLASLTLSTNAEAQIKHVTCYSDFNTTVAYEGVYEIVSDVASQPMHAKPVLGADMFGKCFLGAEVILPTCVSQTAQVYIGAQPCQL
jgi:hypothetical protein